MEFRCISRRFQGVFNDFQCCLIEFKGISRHLTAASDDLQVVSTDVGSGQGFGSGTNCCNFYNDRYKIFCDNFGLVQQLAQCPRSPWSGSQAERYLSPPYGHVTCYKLIIYI